MIARAGIFLLLLTGGAIVNIAVAWACAILAQPDIELLRRAVDEDTEFALGPVEHAWFQSRGWSRQTEFHGEVWHFSFDADPMMEGFGFRSQTVTEYGSPRTPGNDSLWFRDVADFVSAGWPMLALASRAWNTGPLLQRGADRWTMSGAIAWNETPGSVIHRRYLPLRPIWPGFAINTLFYAAILWLLLALPGALRRMRRIKRGLCPACAYPVGASDLCTECGHTLNITSKIAARQRMGLPPPATPAPGLMEAERKP